MFEADNAPQKGVIAFISNRTFLAGKPYAGLRKMLRERFDRIEVIDLRGDVRRGARAGVLGDTGVFNIQVGTAITLAIADGSKIERNVANVTYNDVWEHELFAHEAKLEWLAQGAQNGIRPEAVEIKRSLLDSFKPEPFQAHSWPSLEEVFRFTKSGVKTGSNDVFVALDPSSLRKQVSAYLALKSAGEYDRNNERLSVYRPLDRRWFYNDLRLLNRPGPELQAVWGENNLALYSHPSAIVGGPAAWCHDLLPDYDSFRGSYGGYAFTLYDRRPGQSLNILPSFLEALHLAYRKPTDPQTVLDAILALLSATSYTLRFGEDLGGTFPHVPFPADKALFDRAAEVGKLIRETETFARAPDPQFLTPAIARIETAPHGALGVIGPESWSEGDLILCANGSGKVSGIPRKVWEFSVSGYPVLPRWLAARKDIEVTHDFLAEFRDITGRINELIYRFDEADLVLQEALNDSLTRDQLGLSDACGETVDDRS